MADVDDPVGRLLWDCAEKGDDEGVKQLLDAGGNVDYVNVHHHLHTPLAIAVYNAHVGVIKLLLTFGAKTDVHEENGATPLFVAAQNGRRDIVDLLLAAGADVNLAEAGDGMTPLYVAAQELHLPVIHLLLEHGAEVDKATPRGYTPLFVASQEDDKHLKELVLQVMRCLLDAGANASPADTDDGMTPLHVAVREERWPVCDVLLTHDAAVDVPNHNGDLPANMASELSEYINKLFRQKLAQLENDARKAATMKRSE